MVISCRNLSAKIYPYTRLTIRRVASASRKPRAIITQKPMALHRQAEVDMVQARYGSKTVNRNQPFFMQLRAPTPDVFHTAKALISEQGVAAVGRPLIARTAWLAVLMTFGCARGLAGPPFQIDSRDSSRKSGICR